jgi:hypothetical protein
MIENINVFACHQNINSENQSMILCGGIALAKS